MSIHDFRARARWPISGCRCAPAATSHFSADSSGTSSRTIFSSAITSSTSPMPPAFCAKIFATPKKGDGFFSGWNEEKRAYDKESWLYEGHDLSFPKRDLTLQHPRCVFQTLRRHFARYTPEMVEKICGISPALFHKVARRACRRVGSGQDRGDLLCTRLDATFQGRSDHSHRVDPPVVVRQHWPARRRNSGIARSRLDSRLDRHSDALRYSCPVICRCRKATAARKHCSNIWISTPNRPGSGIELSELFHQPDESLLRQERDARK